MPTPTQTRWWREFHGQTHVVADSAARPPLQNADQLNQQILSASWSWSSAPQLWVAAVAPGQTGVTTPDAIHDIFLGRTSGFSGVILVIDAKGYHVRAYNVPKAVADNVDPLMGQSARDHRNDPYGATSEFVQKLAGVNVASGSRVTTSPVGHAEAQQLFLAVDDADPHRHRAGSGRPAHGSSCVGNSKRRRDAEARDQVKQELIDAESGASDIDNAVLNNSEVDVSAEALKANASLYDARKAYEAGDYGAARAHLGSCSPRWPRPTRSSTSLAGPIRRSEDRKQATVHTRNPETGQPVTINNNNYSTTQQPGYSNYYGGGYYNGMFFYPGYYPYAFWGPGWGWAVDGRAVDGCDVGRPLERWRLRTRL